MLDIKVEQKQLLFRVKRPHALLNVNDKTVGIHVTKSQIFFGFFFGFCC